MPALRHWGGSLSHPPVLIGEDNPQSARPANALWPDPPGCAGHRLCVKVFGMDPRQYLLAFLRYNLCTGRWDADEARRRAQGLALLYMDFPLVLLGAKVSTAFGISYEPFKVTPVVFRYGRAPRVLMLPHPSGRCRVWNDPGSYGRARGALEEVLR